MLAVLQLIVLGLATGSLYALSALGLVVVYRSSNVINLANGGLAMVAGYTMWGIKDALGLPAWLALPVAIGAAVAVSFAMYWLAIRRLSGASSLAKIVATLGVYLVLQSLVQLIFGPFAKIPAPFLPVSAVDIAGIHIGLDQVLIIVLSIVITAVLWAVYRFTRFGLATSAVSENPRSLAALGRSVDGVRAGNWIIAGFLGGVAGVFIAPIVQLNAGVFLLFLVPGLAAAVIGGMRSFPITLIGGMALGAVQVLVTRFVPLPGMAETIPFIVIIVVLVILGRALPVRGYVSERLPRVGSGAINLRLVLPLTVVVLLVAYFLFDPNLQVSVTIMAAAAILGLSFVVVTGYAGQLSLAQVTIAVLGALIAGQTMVLWGFPFMLALVVAVLAIIPVGLLVGLPAVRARGAALTISTLGFAVAINGAVLGNVALNGGITGLKIGSLNFFGIDMNQVLHPERYMTLVVIIFVLVAVVVTNLRRGRAGRRLLAVRTNERAAAALGVNVSVAKLYAFTLAAAIAAIGGVLLLFRNESVLTSGYAAFANLASLAYVVLGGVGYVAGAIVAGGFSGGAFPSALMAEIFGVFDIEAILNIFFPLVGGLILIIQIVAQPGGLVDAILHPPRRKKERKPSALSTTLSTIFGVRAAAQRRARESGRSLEAARQLDRSYRGATLRVVDATVRYGSVIAVEDLSFDVHPGEVLSIIGPNGAGKTTVMDGITGFTRMTGKVELDGQDITSWPAHRRARAGLVRSFQSLELLEDMTVLDNIRAACDDQDFGSYLIDLVHPRRGGLTAASAAAIDTFGLVDLLEVVPTELGYGDRRLVAIARAVASEPAVLLLDEPAAGLSERERERVGQLIRTMADEWHIAIVLVEHDVELVRRVSDRVIALDFGVPIAQGGPHEVLSDPLVIESYLGRAPEEVEADISSVSAHAVGTSVDNDVEVAQR